MILLFCYVLFTDEKNEKSWPLVRKKEKGKKKKGREARLAGTSLIPHNFVREAKRAVEFQDFQ
jgi:hypothetical protein